MMVEASPSTLAAPPISFFMSSMPLAGLMSRPPVSKHTPLPTSVIFGSLSLPHVRSIRRGAMLPARPTAWIIGKFCSRSASPSMVLTFAPFLAARSRAACSSASGPISLVGVLMRSRARVTASAMRCVSAASTPSGTARRIVLPLPLR
ncbi:hypothetical protein D9M69_626890 [compost metagenome]